MFDIIPRETLDYPWYSSNHTGVRLLLHALEGKRHVIATRLAPQRFARVQGCKEGIAIHCGGLYQ